jgi:hypothetical protein
LLQINLSRRRIQQVNAPHNLSNTLRGIIDDDRQMVGELPVRPTNDEVANRGFEPLKEIALQGIVEADFAIMGSQSQAAAY